MELILYAMFNKGIVKREQDFQSKPYGSYINEMGGIQCCRGRNM